MITTSIDRKSKSVSGLMTRPDSKVLIRFPDCDPFHHLNNSRYIDYFINTWEDHFVKNYNYNPYTKIKLEGTGWVISQNRIAYLRPAMLYEMIVIQTRVLSATETKLFAELCMWNAEKTILKSLLWTEFTFMNFTRQKSEPLSVELANLFREIADPLPDGPSFEERIQQIKTSGFQA